MSTNTGFGIEPENRLTDEQRERIRKNRERALMIREKRKEERHKLQSEMSTQSGSGLKLMPASNEDGYIQSSVLGPASKTNLISRPEAINIQTRPNTGQVNVVVEPSNNFTKVKILLEFALMSAERFKVQIKPPCMGISDSLKEVRSRIFYPEDKSWSFLLSDYDRVKLLLARSQPKFNITVDEIPLGVRKLFISKICPSNQNTVPVPEVDLNSIEKGILNLLFPFQKMGLKFGIGREGRLLIADEMGLGKTVQALAIANYYSMEWPLLVVCPSSVKFAWLSQVRRFLPNAHPVVIEKQSEPIPSSRSTSDVMIISYDMMVSKQKELKRNSIYVVIFDECHLLKEIKTKRTIVANELSKIAHRVILLSGTPALSRPSELFTQIRLIDPGIFPCWRSYATRYCEGRQGRFCFEARGRSNPEELKLVMDKIMIRRLKKDVLEDLPEKRREIIYLSGDAIDARMKTLRKAKEEYQSAQQYSIDNRKKKETFMEYYVQTGCAKMKAVADHIVDTFFHEGAQAKKLLVFAHHSVVLDTMGIALAKVGVQFIRIDGSTSARDRAAYCEQFQTDQKTMVAILSITAAGVGITLTAASVVVFAELYWNPSIMIQAEDRAHRVGQKDSVQVQYMLAKKTADTEIWAMVSSKLQVLGEVNLTNETYLDAENTEKLCTSNKRITDFFKLLEDDAEDGDVKSEPYAKRCKQSE